MNDMIIVVGAGEVGTSLYNVLNETYPLCYLRDKEEPEWTEEVEMKMENNSTALHICFPYFEGFDAAVLQYVELYSPRYTVIHSTVPVGTTSKLGIDFVHSPIHGKHPNLEQGIQTYVKYVGGSDPELVREVVTMLNNARINAKMVENAETSELSKILCTTQLGLDAIFCKETKRLCSHHNANFNQVYRDWRTFYNFDIGKNGFPKLKRPVLKYEDGPCGGHCVGPNSRLLDSWMTNIVRKWQDENGGN